MLADILSVLALTMSAEGERVCFLSIVVGVSYLVLFASLSFLFSSYDMPYHICILWFLVEFDEVICC